MDKFYLDEYAAFGSQIEAYLQTHTKLPYCTKCPKPNLCLICMSSIGEAMLIRANTEVKKQSCEPIYLESPTPKN